MIIKNTFLFIFILASLTQELSAQNVLPLFTGQWYEFALLEDVDSCNQKIWKYDNVSDDKDDLIKRLFSNPPKYPSCIWFQPRLFRIETGNDYEPPDFPTADRELLHNPEAILGETWIMDCKDRGTTVQYITRTIYPRYVCPTGSRVMVENGKLRCSTTFQVCFADVVGRDLDVSIGGNLTGHVGLATPSGGEFPNSVLEVLKTNNTMGIKVNSYQSFVNAVPGKFWGEVFGLKDFDYIPISLAERAMYAGYDQQQYPFEYTTTIFWHEGGYGYLKIYDPNTHQVRASKALHPAKFRCDTFVNYCYNKIFSTNLPYSVNILPTSTYSSFLHNRSTPNYLLPVTRTSPRSFNPSLKAIDKKFLHLISENTSRNYKVTKAWNIYKDGDRSERDYALDTLSYLHAHEKVPELIIRYKGSTFPDRKQKLMSTIVDSAIPENDRINNDVFVKNATIAQNFIIDILRYENDDVLLWNAVWSSLRILPINRENYYLITQALARLDHSKSNYYENKFLVEISMALANQEMQNWLLPKMLANLTENQQESFSKKLCFLLKNYSPTDLSANTKELVGKYLKNHARSNYECIDSYFSVTSENEREKTQHKIDHLLTLTDPKEQAMYIKYLDAAILQEISEDDLSGLTNKFQNIYLKTPPEPDNWLYGLAFTKLNQVKKNRLEKQDW